ncbi:HTTM domain-containing protein [Arthrobacter castelli]|uniref:HTTM domain-containing protein n=1 Tax=Arthrobacter castelli TaxID=271431 RepID=UPI000684495C|nr:HTTM domain-containing protein [Arthrobacter castelli]
MAMSTTGNDKSIRNWLRRQQNEPRRILDHLVGWFIGNRHADYGFAVMRIVSGICLLKWLLVNIGAAARLWGPGSFYWDGYREILGYTWPFNILRDAGPGFFWLWYIITIGLVVAFVLGWRTRFVTPLLFVFYTAINAQNTPISDGGNYFIRIMLIYLIFVDISRRWSLDSRRRTRKQVPERETATILHNLGLCLVVAQLCLVYFEAGMYKVQGTLWQNGTAIYYPINSEMYGVFPFLSDLLTASTWLTVLATYFTVVIQIAFPFMLFNRITRRVALIGILLMHVSIAVVMGLTFFSGIMVSADAVLVSSATWVVIAGWLGRKCEPVLRRLRRPVRRAVKEVEPEPKKPEVVSSRS